jgi:DNA polymerase-3 subunit alpha
MTNGTFQFESVGMQKCLKDLKPDKFADLIAMNALYRPGPLEYIPNYIRRKHGKEPITYDLPEMEEYLHETYGITVYQEQVMLLSQKLAGFSKGDADVLRKAMGKKDRATLDKMKSKFIDGCVAKGHDAKICEKVWTDWEAFASYAFNKSHSTCYAFVAFQTAWLKAHYPAEYMASVLTHNMSNIDKISFFLDECKKMGLKVLGPDINESSMDFDVNKNGEIRFGLGAIKGAGEAAIMGLIEEREKSGPYSDVFDFSQRINLRAANKKTFECFALAGAFDSFGLHRAQYFYISDKDNTSAIEKIIRYGQAFQQDKDASQISLFGSGAAAQVMRPKLPDGEPWSDIEKLKREKEVVGFYITGHPLDEFQLELSNFCNATTDKVMEMKNKDVNLAGIVTKAQQRQTKNGKPFCIFSVEDYHGSIEIGLFGENYLKHQHLINPGEFLYMKGKVQPRFGNQDQYEFTPTFIQLLSDVRNKMCKNIVITVPVEILTQEIIDHLEALMMENPGSSNLKMQLVCQTQPWNLEMFSRKFKIAPNNQLLESLKGIPGVDCRISA